MKKRVVVISLGGSLIVPDSPDVLFLEKFKKLIKKNTKKHKFVIVCGGGGVARKYISVLREAGKSDYLQSMVGIAVTRTNARFLSYFFNQEPKKGIPHRLRDIKRRLKKQDIVFCGALEYHPNETSDATSVKIASQLKSEFINLTNVSGLHDKNPLKHKDAKFIPRITSIDLFKMANKIKYKPGQNFILDQTAVKIIKEKKVKTYILGKNLKNLDNLLNNKKFIGTIVK